MESLTLSSGTVLTVEPDGRGHATIRWDHGRPILSERGDEIESGLLALFWRRRGHGSHFANFPDHGRFENMPAEESEGILEELQNLL